MAEEKKGEITYRQIKKNEENKPAHRTGKSGAECAGIYGTFQETRSKSGRDRRKDPERPGIWRKGNTAE